jgi:hypothetical protein
LRQQTTIFPILDSPQRNPRTHVVTIWHPRNRSCRESRLALFLLLTASAPLAAQQAPSQSAASQPPAASASTIEIDPPLEADVDQECRIVTLDTRHPERPKVRRHTDVTICRLEGENDSEHWEKVLKNGVYKNVLIDVHEHEFVLQNPYPERVIYIVHQPISKHYHIDSQPQPVDITNSVATFRVVVAPGQSSRLHVGERD